MSKLCECGCGCETSLSKVTGNGYRRGEPKRYLAGHHPHGFQRGHAPSRPMRPGGYKEYRNGKAHRLRAEHALGHPLPLQAEVHHADGSRNEDAPLVICENRAYHMLLHARMRVRAAGGNPNTQMICCVCHHVKDFELFNRQTRGGYMGRHGRCRSCERVREALRRRPGAAPKSRIRSDCGVLG